MTFAVPLFLTAALAGLIPVILHMIHRQQAKHLPFSTLRFLRISAEKTRRRRRIHDVFLMLLRVAALVFTALALAGPTVTHLKALFGGGSTAVAIVLDNSASMGHIDADAVRFETAKKAAAQIVEQFRDGDQLALYITCGKPFAGQGVLERSVDQANQTLANVKLSYERADVASQTVAAREVLAKAEAANKQLFIISDFQATSWDKLRKGRSSPQPAAAKPQDEQQRKLDEAAIVIVDCHRRPKPNVAVLSVAIEAAVPVAGLPITCSAELFNGGAQPESRIAELYLDGAKEGLSPSLTVPPGGRIRHDFLFRFKSGGFHRGEVRLVGDDGCRLDDRRFFAMTVDQAIPIALVENQRHEIPYLDDAYYLERALRPGRSGDWALRVTSLTARQLSGEPLGNYKVLYLVNLPAPDDETAARLKTYAEQGGHLFWIAGDNVKPDEYNLMNERAGGRLLPCRLGAVRAVQPGDARDSWRINFLDKNHRALRPFTDPASLYEKTLIYRQVQLTADAGDRTAAVLARVDDGEPLVMQKRVDRGSTTFLGVAAQLEWSNLPLRPLFAPLFAKFTFELAGAEQGRREGSCGAPLTLRFDDQIRPLAVEILTPGGETIRRSVDPAGDGEFRFADTREVGVYALRLLQTVSAQQFGYSVNIDPDELASPRMDRKGLSAMFTGAPLLFAENPDDLTDVFDLLRKGRSLWSPMLAAVLILLVFETLVSNRLTPKATDDPALAKLPPGMRRLGTKSRADVLRGAS